MGKINPRRRISLTRWVLGIGIALPLSAVWAMFIGGDLQSFQVISASMAPTMEKGDCVLVRKTPEPPFLDNQIITFHDPLGTSEILTKRVIALGPARVELRSGKLFVNGLEALNPSDREGTSDKTWDLEDGELFVSGDNRNKSNDSIDFGPIPSTLVEGVVVFRYWPPGKAGAIQ